MVLLLGLIALVQVPVTLGLATWGFVVARQRGRRWGWLVAVPVLAGFAGPAGLAVAIALVTHGEQSATIAAIPIVATSLGWLAYGVVGAACAKASFEPR